MAAVAVITVTLTDRQAMLVGNVVKHVRDAVTDHMVGGHAFYVDALKADPQLAQGITEAMSQWLRDANSVMRKIADAPIRPDAEGLAVAAGPTQLTEGVPNE